jgi:hypothetical protein
MGRTLWLRGEFKNRGRGERSRGDRREREEGQEPRRASSPHSPIPAYSRAIQPRGRRRRPAVSARRPTFCCCNFQVSVWNFFSVLDSYDPGFSWTSRGRLWRLFARFGFRCGIGDLGTVIALKAASRCRIWAQERTDLCFGSYCRCRFRFCEVVTNFFPPALVDLVFSAVCSVRRALA